MAYFYKLCDMTLNRCPMYKIALKSFKCLFLQGRLRDARPRRPRESGRPRGRGAGRHPEEAGPDAAVRRLLAGEQAQGQIMFG